MTAPELTPAERATVDRFEAAPDAPESLRERVAEAICCAGETEHRWWEIHECIRDGYRGLADAAIAVITEESR